jgi:hypothetical protein
VRRIGKKASAGVVIVVVALALPLSLIGRAHTFTADSRVTIRYNTSGDAFRGQVFSGRASCRANRTVRLYKVRPGPDRFIGRDRTNQLGVWRIPRDNPHGRFYARVLRRVTTGYAHFHRCLGDRSPTIFVR